MASVKVKFRPSATDGREGSIYYQVIHNRAVRQITADLHVHENEWNAGTSSVTIPSWADADRKHHLRMIQKHISRDVLRLENIIRPDAQRCLFGRCHRGWLSETDKPAIVLQFHGFRHWATETPEQGTYIGNLCVYFVQLHAFQAEQGYTVGRYG